MRRTAERTFPARPAVPGNRGQADISQARFLPFILLLFVGSGCAALIYEIVWYQSLELIVGSNAMSIGVVLGTFMGGMCAGACSYLAT